MKISSRVDGSVCGAVLSKQPSASLRITQRVQRGAERVYTPAATSNTSGERVPIKRGIGNQNQRRGRVSGETPSCPNSSLWLLSTFMLTDAPRKSIRLSSPKRSVSLRSYTTATAVRISEDQRQAPIPIPQAKWDLMKYVNQDGEGTVEEHLDIHRDPYRRGYAQEETRTIRISNKPHETRYPSKDETLHLKDDYQHILTKLYDAVRHRYHHPARAPLEPIYQLYNQLPEPRMLYIPWQLRTRLMRVMGTPRRRDVESMHRYFSLVADVKNAGLVLSRQQWNNALVFASKYASRSSPQDILKLWREMEHGAKVEGNDVTFNILFDVAAKAGNFVLAEMIYQEMEHRGIPFNRYHHVSLIHFFGLKLDSGGVRAAYREMVNSGEIIDTLVLNCVISGLLRCGEEAAAEETYGLMKNGHARSVDMPHPDYFTNKVVTRVLMMFAKISRKHPPLKEQLQNNNVISLTPNMHTYRLLVDHYSIKIGDLKKVAQYLDEMKQLKLAIHAVIFLGIFKGFYSHGGFGGSEWSFKRLQGVLSALYEAKDQGAKGLKIDVWLVIWALRAVNKCGQAEDVASTYDELSQRWDVPPARESFLHSLMENIMHGSDLNSDMGSWAGPEQLRKKKDGSRL